MKDSKMRGEALRFVIVGVIATVLHYGIYLWLNRWMNDSLAYTTLAYTIGYVLSFIANFYLTTYFTFRTTPSWRKLAGLGGTHVVNYLLHIFLLNLYLTLGIPKDWAPIPVYAVAIPVTFLLSRYVFKKKK